MTPAPVTTRADLTEIRRALAHYRIGRRLVFKDADLVAFLLARRVEAREAGGR